MDEIFGFVPGGPWVLGAVALLAVPGVRKTLRPVAKATIKAGIGVVEQVKNLTAEAREQATDLYAEAKAERDDQPAGTVTKVAPVGSRARAETSGSTS